MKELLDLIEACVVFVVSNLVRLFVLAALSLFAFGYMVQRLNLWATPGLWMLSLFTWFGLCLGTAAFSTGKLAKGITYLCTAMLIGISAVRLFQGTAEGIKTVATYQDQKNLERAWKSTVETAHLFACDRSNAETLTYFGKDGKTGETVVLVFYDYDRTGRIWCSREPGVNPKTGTPLKKVTTQDIVDAIAAQEPLHPATVVSRWGPEQHVVVER